MTTYKQQFLKALTDGGRGQTEVNADDQDGCCDEHWYIRSVREIWGLEMLIFLLVDPQRDAPGKEGQGVREIVAAKKSPTSWIADSNRSATLHISKGQVDVKLHEFVGAPGEYAGLTR